MGPARFGAAFLAPPFLRRRYGAAVLAPDTLTPRKGAGHFGAEEGRRTLWRRRRAPDKLAPDNFFFGTNLPKTGRVITLTKTGLNSNRNGS